MKKEKLTKFSDYVYYYKWHVIITLIVVVLVAGFVQDCATKIEDDLSITLMLSNYADMNTSEEISGDLVSGGIIPDINGDGVKQMYTKVITSPIDGGEETMMASYQITIAFSAEDSMLFLVDEDLLELYEDQEIFADISDKAEKYGIADDSLYIAEDGTPMGISLKDNAYLKSKGVVTDTLYACFRKTYESNLTEEAKVKMEVADKIFEYMTSQAVNNG